MTLNKVLNAYSVKPGMIIAHCASDERYGDIFCVTEVERFDLGTRNYPNRPCIGMSLLSSDGSHVKDYDISVAEFSDYWTLFGDE